MQAGSTERNLRGYELDLYSTDAGAVQQGEGWALNIVMIFLCFINSAECVDHLSDCQLLKDSAALSS